MRNDGAWRSISRNGLIALSTCVASAAGQVTVDPSGGGQFTQLQAAIDAVPPNTVLRVVGGTYGPLVITKSLTIIGDPAPTITSPSVPPGPTLRSAISLQGSGADRLVLSRVVITGQVDGFLFGSAQPSIGGSGFASLHVYDSTVHAPTWFNLTGSASGTSAISLSGATVVIARSDVRGADSGTDGSGIGAVAPGVPGISAETVIVLDSDVVGGGAGTSYFKFGPPQSTPCPCSVFSGFGVGGPGISANRLFDAGSTIQGGAGSPVLFTFIGPIYWPWGSQPGGPPFTVGQHVAIESALFAFAPPELGRTFAINVYSPVFGSGAVVVGAMSSAPTLYMGSWLFLDPTALYGHFPAAPGLSTLALPIPNVQALAGFSLSFQYVSNAGTLYNPVATVITF